MIELLGGGYRLHLTPALGGSIARFDWRDMPLMRATCGPSAFDTACFPLVPFSNRIAFGRFAAGDREVRLRPNFPDSDHPHTLHGFGWLSAWSVIAQGRNSATLRHAHAAGEWPWHYVAEQTFSLSDDGLVHGLSVTNLGATAMPTGLGFHPYFPCDAQTFYRGLHRCEVETAADGLPVDRRCAPAAVDWWNGAAVATRAVDTVYVDRDGPLAITWPDRQLRLTITPCASLRHTVVYTPHGAGVFCVEPVSHLTDAHNHPAVDQGLVRLAPGEALRVEVTYRADRPSAE